MPITGVMPEPAVTNRAFAGRCSGRQNSPAAWSSWMSVPGVVPVHQVVADTLPSGIALTVTLMQPSVRVRSEVSE